jgi:hypothetical protein
MSEPNPIPPIMTRERLMTFWSLVSKNVDGDCWLWVGRKDRTTGGFYYGRFCVGYKKYLAHRISYYLHNKRWPKLYVCHTCDFPLCVNPEHLFEGTNADNMRDMAQKGRAACGSRSGHYTQPERTPKGSGHHRTRLTEQMVIDMREEYRRGGVTHSALARRFGLSKFAIHSIITRRTWKHV